MQTLYQGFRRLSLCNKYVTNTFTHFPEKLQITCTSPSLRLIPSVRTYDTFEDDDPQGMKRFKFLKYNEKIYPPQSPGEERRPAFVCHVKSDIKYSPKKMWYIACFVRGMSVDEALKQLSFVNKKGAEIAKDAIIEAQRMAVEQHNVEFKSNLWVAESFVGKGTVIKGFRKHARGRRGEIRYTHCHYFVRLEEGKPPKEYYARRSVTGEEMLDEWKNEMRMRRIVNSL